MPAWVCALFGRLLKRLGAVLEGLFCGFVLPNSEPPLGATLLVVLLPKRPPPPPVAWLAKILLMFV